MRRILMNWLGESHYDLLSTYLINISKPGLKSHENVYSRPLPVFQIEYTLTRGVSFKK